MNLADFPLGPGAHLRLSLIGVAVSIGDRIGDEVAPFLAEYRSEMAAIGGRSVDADGWAEAVDSWAARDPTLPLLRLRRAGLDAVAFDVLLTVGLAAEDPRFADLLGQDGRPTFGSLVGLWRLRPDGDRPDAVRSAVNSLMAFGLIVVANPQAMRAHWEFSVSAAAWDALSGEAPPLAGVSITEPYALDGPGHYIGPVTLTDRLANVAALLERDPQQALCIRGPARNGRRTLAAALAHAIRRPLMAVDPALIEQAEAWRQVGLVAFILGAVVTVRLVLGPGEARELQAFAVDAVRLIVIAGPNGGVGISGRPQSTVWVTAPLLAERQQHWRRALPALPAPLIDALAREFRLTSGTIARAAVGATALAAQSGREAPGLDDVREALRDLQDVRLEAVASRIEVGRSPEFIALEDVARDEMTALAIRCRNREALSRHAGIGSGGLGVRALFAGPSGAGKTLAARRLAHDLAKDIWRIDLAATVSKYIGETEKALDRAFAAAEELDVILLLDEGDALLARRTDVSNANDRYANLETNFLLQRIETFAGVLIVTTNAADRIDKAFSRRMDVVVPFRQPDELRRYEILEHHLGQHRASDALVQEIAVRCALSGGQLRNVALHARLLALDAAQEIGDAVLREALMREYRKTDAHCPLKPLLSAVG